MKKNHRIFFVFLCISAVIVTLSGCKSNNKQSESTLANRWRENLVTKKSNSSAVSPYVKNLNTTANHIYKTMKTPSSKNGLWKKPKTILNSAYLTLEFTNLEKIVTAVETKGTSLYHNKKVTNKILNGFKYLTKQNRYDGKHFVGNWYDWQIAIPESFLNSIFMLKNTLPASQKNHYVKIMESYVPDPYHQMPAAPKKSSIKFQPGFKTLAGNRAHLAHVTLGLGILDRSDSRIKSAVKSVAALLKDVHQEDGFYHDNSLVAHFNIPYTGGYGDDLLRGVTDIYSLVSQTKFEVSKKQLDLLENRAINAYLPVLNEGYPMANVMGRDIVRPQASVSGAVYTLARISSMNLSKSQNRLQDALGYFTTKNRNSYIKQAPRINDAIQISKFKKRDTNPVKGEYTFNSMDRFINHGKYTNSSISMYSSRISAFEYGNKENSQGWHLSDGVLCIYTKDQQFKNDYWETVDPYRLPGTTVDTRPLPDAKCDWMPTYSSESQVGSLSKSGFSIIGMKLNKNNFRVNGINSGMNLVANKSWFTNGHFYVALGAGISGKTDSSIETIVDNHQISSDDVLTNNQNDIIKHTAVKTNPKQWLLLKNKKDSSQNIGYLFTASNQNLAIYQESRSAKVTNNTQDTSKKITNHYQILSIQHGANVENGSYSYALIPGATKASLNKMSNDPGFKILANNKNIQTVKFGTITMSNVWGSNQTVDHGIVAIHPMSIMIKKIANNEYKITMSNPKQDNSILYIQVTQGINKIVDKDKEFINSNKDNNLLQLDTRGLEGASRSITIKTKSK